MATIAKIIAKMRRSPKNIRFAEARKVCEYYFGPPRQHSGSHCIYKTPWAGDPRVNIQNNKGMAKAYQVRQILKAVEKLEADDDQE